MHIELVALRASTPAMRSACLAFLELPMSSPTIRSLVADTIAILEAVARGDAHKAEQLARRVREVSWSLALPGIASAVGAFEHSIARGARSETDMRIALQSVAYEV